MTNPTKVEPERHKAEWVVGLSIYGGVTAGVASLVIGLMAFFSGRLEAAGSCLIAAAVAFGALANALLRD